MTMDLLHFEYLKIIKLLAFDFSKLNWETEFTKTNLQIHVKTVNFYRVYHVSNV